MGRCGNKPRLESIFEVMGRRTPLLPNWRDRLRDQLLEEVSGRDKREPDRSRLVLCFILPKRFVMDQTVSKSISKTQADDRAYPRFGLPPKHSQNL